MIIKKFIVAIGLITAVGAPGLYAATRQPAQQADTIVCPLTGARDPVAPPEARPARACPAFP